MSKRDKKRERHTLSVVFLVPEGLSLPVEFRAISLDGSRLSCAHFASSKIRALLARTLEVGEGFSSLTQSLTVAYAAKHISSPPLAGPILGR